MIEGIRGPPFYLVLIFGLFFSFIRQGNEGLKPQEVVELASRPNAQVVEVPKAAGGSYVQKINHEEKKVDLKPPVVKPAGFFYVMPNYTTNEGLVLDAILCGTRDNLGNLWFGTQGGGVSRFDGKTFTNYTESQGLADDTVHSIYADKEGRIWMGTDQGVSRYDGEAFVNFSKREGLADNYVRSIFQDTQGAMWFGTYGGGASRYDGKAFTTFSTEEGLASNKVLSILQDRKGILWFGTDGGGVSRFDGTSFTTFTVVDGLPANTITCLLEDSSGKLWLGTGSEGVCRYEGKSFISLTTHDGLVNNKVSSLLEDFEGNIWIGTTGGASKYHHKLFTDFTTSQGLADNDIRCIVEDKANNLWFGTNGAGLSRYDGSSFTTYGIEQGLGNSVVRSIVQDKAKHFWFGTSGGGVSRYDGKTFTTYTQAQGLLDDFIRGGQMDHQGNLWFGTEKGGLSRFDGKAFTTYTTDQGLPNNDVRAIIVDGDDHLWIGTEGGGLSYFDGKSFTNYTTKQGLASNHIRNLYWDRKGDLWITTNGGGISRFDGKTFTNYTKKQGLGGDIVWPIFEDKEGNLWFGTSGDGISRFDGQSFLNFTKADGLPDDVIYQIVETNEQYLVLGTNEGLAILTGFIPQKGKMERIPPQNKLANAELKNYTPQFEIYNSKMGYPVKDENGGQNSMKLDTEGAIWVGTGSEKTGLIRFDYNALHKNKNPPEVYIQGVKVDEEKISWNDLLDHKKTPQAAEEKGGVEFSPKQTEEVTTFGRSLTDKERAALRQKFGDIQFSGLKKFYFVPENLVLPHIHNNVTIDFAAIEPARPQDVLYQYILEGYHDEWSPPTNNTSATFGNIFEGTYHFKVKARSPDGVWSEPTLYTFTVLPPWYRTWWAYLLYAASTISAIFSYIRWRTAKLRRQYEQLEHLYHASERFVPKRILQLLNRKHVEDVQLGDSVKLEITALFADIRGFTTLAESLTPEQTAFFLNTYMSYMAPIIRKNKGFVNQFLGDGIMALFPEHPSHSVEGALAMIEALPRFNKEIQEKGFASVTVGIGINTGDAMLCALGEEERLEASVVSDAINTASRVEGLNKFYKTHLLISETVFRQLTEPDKYLIRLVDKVRLKGKSVGTKIYEVKPLPQGEELKAELLYYQLYAEAFSFYEKGDFVQAQSQFNACLEKKPDDAVVKLLISRCLDFLKTGAPQGWDGTVTLSEK